MSEVSEFESSRDRRKAELLERAEQHCRQREYSLALQCFEELTRSFPYDVEVLCAFAGRAHEMGAERLACGLLSSAARLRPQDAEILVKQAGAFIRVRSLSNAEKALRQARDAEPGNGHVLAGLMRLYAALGDYGKAQVLYDECVRGGRGTLAPAELEMANIPLQKLWEELSSADAPAAELDIEPHGAGNASEPAALTARLLSDAECDALVHAGAAREGQAATVGEGAVDESARQSTVHWLTWPDLDPAIARRLIAFMEEGRRRFAIRGIDQFERLQLSCYTGENSGHFDWHRDTQDLPEATARKLSLALPLSPASSYQGGELELQAEDGVIGVPRSRGCAVLFRSGRLHRVAPVTAGTRWSLVCWARGPVGGAVTGLRLLN